MNIVKIDDRTYDYDLLSDDAKGQLKSIQFVDAEIGRLNARIAVLQTARAAYSRALGDALPQRRALN
ncbi:MAG: hypothetical protein HY777_16515 [Betaproteobacteria bacterium]|nr:hypothetical protein [Betaproteobacteria bacterium]